MALRALAVVFTACVVGHARQQDGASLQTPASFDPYGPKLAEGMDFEDSDTKEMYLNPWGRQLQTGCSPPAINRGSWTGLSPDLTKVCGWFSSGSMTTNASPTTFTLSCGSGYYLVGASGYSCSAWKTCVGSGYPCRDVCVYSFASRSGCTYCCACTSYYSFASVTSSCAQCIPPAAANAINPPLVDGAFSYTWSCALGYYAAPVTRTCSSTGGGAWSGAAIVCNLCPTPATPTNGFITRPSTNDIWQFQCNPGFYNAAGASLTQLRCLANSATYSTTGSAIATCSACTAFGAGYYCTGSAAPQQCSAGYFGSPGVSYSASTCGGTCTAGYFCPAGSRSSTAIPCGNAAVFCPAGSGSPTPVTAGFYTTPTTGSVALRTGQALCPAFRSCTNGLIDPGIILDPNVCVGGRILGAAVQEFFTFAPFQGAALSVTTPGYTGSIVWTIDAVYPANPTNCRIDTTWFTTSGGATAGSTVTLLTSSKALNYANCSDGFTIVFTATRSNDATIKASCQAFTEVLQVARPPVVTDCNSRSVNERSLLGTAVGTPLAATNPNVGTSILWYINTTMTGPMPFSIGLCDGQVRVLKNILYTTAPFYLLDINIRNDGSSLGMGSVQVNCQLRVNITQVPAPPVITVKALYVPELVPIGTLAGNIGIQDPGNWSISSITMSTTDVPNIFRVNGTNGNIVTTAIPDSLVMNKAVWTYQVNVTNAIGVMGSDTILINLVPVPRPPQTFDQVRTTPDNMRTGRTLPPVLFASHPQGLNMTFSLTPNNVFDVYGNGTVYLKNGPLDYYVQNYYVLSFLVTDTNGRTASAALTITVTAVPRPPYWVFGSSIFNFSLVEGSMYRQALTTTGGSNIVASNVDTRVTITYRVVSSNPAVGMSLFAIDIFTGAMTVGAGVDTRTGYLYDPALSYPQLQTFQLNLQALDSNGLTANGTAFVKAVNIQPRIVFPAQITQNGGFIMTSGQLNTIGSMVANMSLFTWSPYPTAGAGGTPFVFSMDAEQTAEGDNTFVINPVTGVISIANVSYLAGNGSTTGGGGGGGSVVYSAPRWNYNTKNMFDINVTVSQGALQRVINFKINLPHTNRPPVWTRFPALFAPAASPGTVGPALFPSVIYDPDALLPFVGENLTFAITGGNTDNTFNVSAATGQIQVANENTPSFAFVPGGRNQYNLTITVTDAGINGPRYTATGYVVINMTLSNFAPSVRFQNFSIPERRPYGTVVGVLNATDRNAFNRLKYTLSPRGRNVNRPFPFNVTTSYAPQYSNTQGVGIITVVRDPTDTLNLGLDFNDAFSLYYATVTVTDDDASVPLSSTADVEIWVTWVPEPPYFKTPVVITLPEHMPAGYNVGTIVGWSKDIWQRPQLTYAWSTITPLATRNLFTLAANGAVTLSATAGDLAVINQLNFTLTVIVTDMNNLKGNTSVVIVLQDMPEPARLVGLFNPFNNVSVGTSMRLLESAPVGTVVGYLRVRDDDVITNPSSSWGATYFALDPASADSAYFTVDPTNGAIRTAMALDFWDQTNFTVNVSVADGLNFYQSIAYFPVPVILTQTNTVAVTGFFVDPATPATLGVNDTGMAGAPAVRVTTTGVATPYVYITGRGFGPTQRRINNERLSIAATNITATYGSGRYFTTCRVVVPNTVAACPVPAGTGDGYTWTVTVANRWTAASAMTMSYMVPTISSILRVGGNPLDNSTQTFPSVGGAQLQITGTNFGPAGTIVRLAYGRSSRAGYEFNFGAITCVFGTAHTVVICTTAAGIGGNLKYSIQVDGQKSTDFTDTAAAYTKPAITKVTAPVLATRGGQPGAIYINGTNLGPAGIPSSDVVVTYAGNFADPYYVVFQASNCRIDPSNSHRGIICDTVSGVGANLEVRVTIGGQTSPSATDKLSYATPILTALAGPGKRRAQTVGGQEVILSGSNFGPLTPLFPNGTGIPSSLQPSARYGSGGVFKYTAYNCRVITVDTTISCFTVEGTGYNLLWAAFIGGQPSATLTSDSTDYHPPIVAAYAGAGSDNAFTYGGQSVVITGANFGPTGTLVDATTYGNDDNGTQFNAANCVLTVPHTEVTCDTVVGAGGGLRWFLTIGGQRSVTPTTAYGAPVVSTFSGPGAVDASTDGGQTVTIDGDFFSIDKWLDYVTYGPSGTEFRASNCFLTRNHTQLTCTTRPGVGRSLKWYVSVGKQLSRLSDNFTSYAIPRVNTVSRLNATTDGFTAPGGTSAFATLEGTEFALSYPLAQPVVKINNLGLPRPPAADIDAHWAAIYAGSPGITTVQQWIDSLTSLYPSDQRTLSRGNHRMSVNIPAGFGKDRDMFLLAGGIPSNRFNFTYSAPVIKNIAPDRQNVSFGYLRVFIEGFSFCDGHNGCGVVKVDGVPATPISWTHTQIYIIARDPSTGSQSAAVTVEVGGITSNAMNLSRPVPNINGLVAQNNYINMDTRGGEDFRIRGILDVGGINDTISIMIGGRDCTDRWGFVDNGVPPTDRDVSYTIVCRTPPGIGRDLPILLTFQNTTSRDDPSFRFSYGAPTIRGMRMLVPFYDGQTASAAAAGTLPLPGFDVATPVVAGLPTLGAIIVIDGFNFGTPSYGVPVLDDPLGRQTLQILFHNHTMVVALVPAGDGSSHAVRFAIGNQASNILPFAYAGPTVTALLPDHGPTTGGTLVQLVGVNFGISKPIITFGSSNCTVVEPFNISANHSVAYCYAPLGQGRNIPVTVKVNGQVSQLPAALWSYDPPLIYSVFPANGPTTGRIRGPLLPDGVHRADGDRIVQTVLGVNFGSYGRVSYLPYVNSDPLARNFTVPNQDIISWNDTAVVYYMPVGFGYSLLVSVYADQDSPSVVEFSYDPPVVTAVARFDLTVQQCQDYQQCFSFGNTTRCRAVPAGCFETRGGYALEIVGENFGIQSMLRALTQVRIGRSACVMTTDPTAVAALSHTRLVCIAPSGLGEQLPVTVTLGSRTSALTNMSTFTFDPPVVSLISPNTPDATGKQLLLIRGKNFGFDETPASIKINDQPCVTSEWLNDAQLRCMPPAQAVGAKNVTILVANRTMPYTYFDIEEALIYQCAKYFYGLEGEVCLKCPQGASCPGAERLVDLVNATEGFWRLNVSSTNSEDALLFCDAPRRSTRDACPIFMPCGPPEACLAGNICAEGYDGGRCAYCLAGQYYRQNDQCVKCPNNLPVLYAGLAVMFILIALFAWFLNSRNVSLALISVGVDWAQVVSMFARTKIRWPKLLKQLFQVLSAFNLNLEITAPECLNPGIQFWQKWFFIEAIPLAVAGILATAYFARWAYKAWILRQKKVDCASHLPQSVSTFIVLFRIIYLYITKTSFDVLNCTPTDPPTFRDVVNKKDSIEYMSGFVQPEYECWAKNSWQVFLFPFGVGTLVTYTFVLPGIAFYKLSRSRYAMRYDQILRAKGSGDDRLSNPYFEFRSMWQKLYYHYRPDKWYWEFCITARKMFIAGIALAFRQIPSYQLAIALLVLFAAYVLHVLHWPYMSHTTRDGVLDEFRQRSLYDETHIKIDKEMIEVEKKNVRKRQKANVFDNVGSRKRLDNAVLMIAFDSNTVEGILLGCCVLVALAGIMLDSKRFDGDNWFIPQVQREYTGLTFGCLMLIVLSIIYYAVVFTIEMSLIFCPAAVPHMLWLCRSRAAAVDTDKIVKANEAAASAESGVAVNPMLINSADSGTEEVVMGKTGIIDAKQVMTIQQPTPAMWKAVQQSYGRLQKITNDLQRQARDAQLDVSTAKEAGADEALAAAAAVRAQRQRVQMPPVATSGDAQVGKSPREARQSMAMASVAGFKAASSLAALKGRPAPPPPRVKVESSSSDDSDGEKTPKKPAARTGAGAARQSIAAKRAASMRRATSFGGTFVANNASPTPPPPTVTNPLRASSDDADTNTAAGNSEALASMRAEQ